MEISMDIDRRTFVLGGSAAALTLTFGLPAFAKALPLSAQVGGAQHFNVGDITVSALADGSIPLDPGLFPTANKDELQQALKRAFVSQDGKIRGAVNAYVARVADKTVLIDSGGGSLLGPSAGLLPQQLAAASVTPADIDVLAMTHLHPDHIGGLVGKDGKPVFPNATMLLHEKEIAFWRDDAIRSQAPDEFKVFFDAARQALDAYKGKTTPFGKDGEVLPGVEAVHLPGHTPGHTGFNLVSGDQSLLIWGDIVHVPALQFGHPDWSISFDVDPDLARATRKKIFDRAKADGLRVAGMHLLFPGVGYVVDTASAYEFVPQQWDYDLADKK
jgi:glyoxylase-like metal-dependent hydrolase (beta-lactamase superfamily II)